MGPATRRAELGTPALRRLAAVVCAAALASGCSWGEKYRVARPRELLEVESFTVSLPEGTGWSVERERDAGWRKIEAVQAEARGSWIRHVELGERERSGQAPTRDELAAWARAEALRLVGDPRADVQELPATPDPRFGPSAVVVVARAEESDASAGLLVKRAAGVAVLQFAPPEAPDRICVVQYEEAAARRGATVEELGRRWSALLASVALRPVDAAAVRSAARPDFPKSFEPRLSRRSLTLPAEGFQLRWGRERWIAPGGFDGVGGLSYGIRDRVELSLPGYVEFAFGEPEALVRPELVLGLGLSRWERDATRGNVWGGAVNVAARKRLGANVGVLAGGFVEATHASRTGRDALYGGAAAGLVWDPAVLGFADLLSLGLEVGWETRDVVLPSRRLAWVGGRNTPLATVHLPLVDVGLTGGVGWDGEDVGALVGFELALTF